MIRFHCPHCHVALRSSDRRAGTVVHCVCCKGAVTIPGPLPTDVTLMPPNARPPVRRMTRNDLDDEIARIRRKHAPAHDPFAEMAQNEPAIDDDVIPVRRPVTIYQSRAGASTKRPGVGFGVASVSLGVIGIVFTVGACATPLVWPLVIILSILAIIFGGCGLGSEGGGMACAGLVLGLLSLAALALTFAVGVVAVGSIHR